MLPLCLFSYVRTLFLNLFHAPTTRSCGVWFAGKSAQLKNNTLKLSQLSGCVYVQTTEDIVYALIQRNSFKSAPASGKQTESFASLFKLPTIASDRNSGSGAR